MKPNILIFLDRYLPGYKAGGPVQTIANMVSAIGDRYRFHIVTTDRDLGDSEAYPAVRHGEGMKVGQALVRYLAPKEKDWHTYGQLLKKTDFDLVYCQSFFNPKFTIIPLLSLALSCKRHMPVLLAPRGEFASGALAHKRFKKKMFIFLYKHFLSKLLNYSFHASSRQEEAAIHQIAGKHAKCFIALNFNAQDHIGPDDIVLSDHAPLRLAFLGRIDVQKNVDYALNLLCRVNIPVQFDLFGPTYDDGYAQRCRALAGQMPKHIRVTFKGPLPHPNVLDTLKTYDLFFFPTKNENFGHVIHEALRAGLPILISDRTPWHEMEARNAGWECPLNNPAKFAEHIEAYAAMSTEQQAKMHQAALQYGIDVSRDQRTRNDNIYMIDALLNITHKTDKSEK